MQNQSRAERFRNMGATPGAARPAANPQGPNTQDTQATRAQTTPPLQEPRPSRASLYGAGRSTDASSQTVQKPAAPAPIAPSAPAKQTGDSADATSTQRSPLEPRPERAALLGNLWGRQVPAAVANKPAFAPSPSPVSQASNPRVFSAGDEPDFEPDLPTGDAAPMRRLGGGVRVSATPSPHARRPTAMAVNYSDQQNTVIHCPSKLIVVNAFAGTGKTTTAVGYADARPQQKILYIAFNKAIRDEAQLRFGPNVECRTTHSLAYSAVGRFYQARLSRPWRTLTLRNEAGIATVRQAAITQSILNKFFQSTAKEVGVEHALEASIEFNADDVEIHSCAQLARNIWVRMQDRQDSISIPDDAYLKMWALTRPKLPFDHIIFDEAQDSNPVIEEVVRAQIHAKLLYIGDRHQSIYAFRGANNAMDGFGDDAKQLHLSQTWRFGPRIAHVANLILGELKGEKVKIEGMGVDSKYVPGSPVTQLARTNAQLFKEAAQKQGKGVHWIGGSKSYRIDRLLDAYYLYKGDRSKIDDPVVRQFSSWLEMQQYAEEARDREIKVMAEVIDEYRNETPNLVKAIRDNEVHDARDAQTTLTTGHRAKGLDWDFVSIAEDFEILADTEAALAQDPTAEIEEQEIHLLYVVCTRAKKQLQLNEETLSWIEKLPEHRAAREIALNKHNRLLASQPTHG